MRENGRMDQRDSNKRHSNPGDDDPCPCSPGRAYGRCCGPLHRGERIAGTAEALMRSRYTAYVRGDLDYVRTTWHPSTRSAAPEALEDAGRTRWLGLDVKRHAPIDADHALVEFVARYRVGGGSAVRLHEISRFVREDGRWYYVDGDFPQR